MTNKEIRAHSLERLGKQWYLLLIPILLSSAVSGVISYYQFSSGRGNLTGNILNLIIDTVFSLIIAKISLIVANDEKFTADKIKFRFKDYFRTFIFGLLYAFLIFAIVLLAAAIVGISMLTNVDSFNGLQDVKYLIITNILVIAVVFIGMVIAVIIFELNYGFTVFIISEKNDDIGAIDSMRYSRELIKGNRIRFLLLMVPVIILEILTFVIGGVLIFLVNVILGIILSVILMFIISLYMYILSADFYLEMLGENEEKAWDYGIINTENEYSFRTIKPKFLNDEEEKDIENAGESEGVEKPADESGEKENTYKEPENGEKPVKEISENKNEEKPADDGREKEETEKPENDEN